jgi:hypothetical protein
MGGVGIKAQVVSAGSEPHEKFNDWVEPFTGVTVSTTIPGWPAMTVSMVGMAEMVKSGAGAFTVGVSTVEVLVAKAALPRYCAVIECGPAVSDAVANVATPPAPTAPLPI